MKFIDALMDVIASENRAHAKGAQRALDILVDVAVKIHDGDKVFVFSFLFFLNSQTTRRHFRMQSVK
jgi:hypothetical protein